MENAEKQTSLVPAVAVVSICTGAALILLSYFRWDAHFLIILISPFVTAGIWLLVFVWSLIHIVKLGTLKSATSLFINIAFLVVLIYAPVAGFWVSNNFAKYETDRKAVVSLVESNEIDPDSTMWIQLNDQFKHVSVDGDIIVDRDLGLVFFFTFKGLVDNYSGFVYIKEESTIDDLLKLRGHEIFYDPIEFTKMAPNWYFISNT